MIYTIMILDSLLDGQKVKLNKVGFEYTVTLYHELMKESTTKRFDNLLEAMHLFERLARAIGTGSFSYEARKSWLLEGKEKENV